MSYELSDVYLNTAQTTSEINTQQSTVDSEEQLLFEAESSEASNIIYDKEYVQAYTKTETPIKDILKGIKSLVTGKPVYEYDENGNIISKTDGLTKTEYDENGNVTSVTERSLINGKTITEYDENGNITSKKEGLTTTEYTYYENGAVKTEKIIEEPSPILECVNPEVRITLNYYDEDGNLTSSETYSESVNTYYSSSITGEDDSDGGFDLQRAIRL